MMEINAWRVQIAETFVTPVWVDLAIKDGRLYWQGGGNPYFTSATTGRRAHNGDWLVLFPDGQIIVATSNQIDSVLGLAARLVLAVDAMDGAPAGNAGSIAEAIEDKLRPIQGMLWFRASPPPTGWLDARDRTFKVAGEDGWITPEAAGEPWAAIKTLLDRPAEVPPPPSPADRIAADMRAGTARFVSPSDPTTPTPTSAEASPEVKAGDTRHRTPGS